MTNDVDDADKINDAVCDVVVSVVSVVESDNDKLA